MMLEATAQTGKWISYQAYKDSGVEWLGEVPAHWRVDRVKWATTGIINGVWGDEPDGDDDLICVRVADFNRDKFVVTDNPPTLRSVSLSNRQGRLLQSGDLLIEKSGGGDKQLVGCVVLFEHAFNAVCSNFIARMRVLEPNSARFWCYIYAALYASRLNYPAIKQTTGIQNLDTTSYFETRVGYPPIDEQRTIADFLDHQTEKIDTLVAKKRTLIERLKEERTALITHTVTRGLPPEAAHAVGLEPHPKLKSSGIEWLGDVPEHWEICKLKRVTISRCDGPFGSSLKSEHYSDTGVRVIRLQNIRFAQFDDRDAAFIEPEYYEELGDHNVLPYDLLIAGLGDENYPVGRACVVPSTLGAAMVKADCFRFRLIPDRANSAYVALQLSTTANALAGALATGTTRGRMNLATTENRDIALPPLSEQTAIADFLDRKTAKIDTLVTKIEIAIERLQEYRSALITAAVTGKIDVREDRERKLTNKSIETIAGGKFLTIIDKKIVDILSSARDKNFSDEGFLDDYNILNFYRNVSNFIGLRSLFPNSFSDNGIDLQNLKKEHREWMNSMKLKSYLNDLYAMSEGSISRNMSKLRRRVYQANVLNQIVKKRQSGRISSHKNI